jgi:uncharacterized protein YPO0396
MNDEQRATLIAWLTRQIDDARAEYRRCEAQEFFRTADVYWGRWTAFYDVQKKLESLGEAPRPVEQSNRVIV